MKILRLTSILIGMAVIILSSCNGPEKKATDNMPSDSLKTAVAKSLDNYVLAIKDGVADTSKTMEIIRTYLDANPAVYGTAIAFEPVINGKDSLRYSLYSYRTATGYETKNFGQIYDYTKDAWYSAPVAQKKAIWTDPYFDAPGGNVQMITYSVPISKADGSIQGVITADLEIKAVKE